MELRDDDRIDLGATGARPMLSCGGTDRFRLEAPPVGNLTDVRLWHDGSSDRPSWCARQTALARTGMALARTGMALARTGMALARTGMALARIGMALARIGMALARIGMALARTGMALAQLVRAADVRECACACASLWACVCGCLHVCVCMCVCVCASDGRADTVPAAMPACSFGRSAQPDAPHLHGRRRRACVRRQGYSGYSHLGTLGYSHCGTLGTHIAGYPDYSNRGFLFQPIRH
jgi:hypothetical protein